MIQKQKRKRGRPRKSPPKNRRLAHSVREYCQAANRSRASAFRDMADGRVKYIQPGGPGTPRQIPTTEYVRLGLVGTVDEV
jgi:hypothetical protein